MEEEYFRIIRLILELSESLISFPYSLKIG